MVGKSIGSGLLDDSGKVVREVEDSAGDVIVKYISHGWLNGPPNHHVLIPPVDDLTNYQNDGMGCPTEVPLTKKLEEMGVKKEHFLSAGEVVTKPIPSKKPKATKLKRVK